MTLLSKPSSLLPRPFSTMPSVKRGRDSHDSLPSYAGLPRPKRSKASSALAERKFKPLQNSWKVSPYPSLPLPTPEACEAVHQALVRQHGPMPPREAIKFEDDAPGEDTDRGLATGILDAVIRCVLGLNTNARVRSSCSLYFSFSIATSR